MDNNISIQLNKKSDNTLYMQLYIELKNKIESGDLKNGYRLPPIRKLSEELGVNNVTVINAYKLLESNGYAYTKAGSGTYITAKSSKIEDQTLQRVNIPLFDELASKEGSINFSDSSPDPELFPVNDFKVLLNKILERDGGSAFGYTEPKGYRPLRECLCSMMEKYDVMCSTDDIVVISGAQQGIDIIAKVMIDYHDVIVTEEPTYTGAIAVFKSRGAVIESVPIKQSGLDIDFLEYRLKSIHPKFIYVMPNYQNPTGYSYSESTIKYLLNLAEKNNFYIIEDDYLSDLYYSPQKPKLLKSYDSLGRVILIKSFSKIFMPGMRIGFMIVPEKLQQRIAAAKHLSDISTSGFIQRIFELYIKEDKLDKHMEYIRQEYKMRYEAIIRCISENLTGYRYYAPGGGIHLWLKLKEGMSANMLYSKCLMENIIISPGSSFYIDKKDSEYIRLSFASTSIDEIEQGISMIKMAAEEI